jgi:Lon-like ATP-dependent protease
VDITTIILPEENRKDYMDLPEFVTAGMDIHFVETYDQVFDLAFPQTLPKPLPILHRLEHTAPRL